MGARWILFNGQISWHEIGTDWYQELSGSLWKFMYFKRLLNETVYILIIALVLAICQKSSFWTFFNQEENNKLFLALLQIYENCENYESEKLNSSRVSLPDNVFTRLDEGITFSEK